MRAFYFGNLLQIIHLNDVSHVFFVIQIIKWAETPYFDNIVTSAIHITVIIHSPSSINLIPLKGELIIILDLSRWYFQLTENRGSKKEETIF